MKSRGFVWAIALGMGAFFGPVVWAQSQVAIRLDYIERHAPLAVAEMRAYGIPASITLAQGILESADGKSRLAREGNNHFGIKCHQGWTGASLLLTDDRPDECFRVYGSVEESYRDHSLFLKTRSRYAALFQLAPTDYKGWAHGLKKAGYATAPDYAERLIKLIETNELDRFDRPTKGGEVADSRKNRRKQALDGAATLHGVPFYIAQKDQTWDEVSRETGIAVATLLRHNDALVYTLVKPGMPIYLKRKKARTTKDQPIHTVVAGDTPWALAQRYGIRVKSLYAINNWEAGEQLTPGEKVVLR